MNLGQADQFNPDSDYYDPYDPTLADSTGNTAGNDWSSSLNNLTGLAGQIKNLVTGGPKPATPAKAPAASSPPPWLLPVGIGVAVVALIGFVAFRGK